MRETLLNIINEVIDSIIPTIYFYSGTEDDFVKDNKMSFPAFWVFSMDSSAGTNNLVTYSIQCNLSFKEDNFSKSKTGTETLLNQCDEVVNKILLSFQESEEEITVLSMSKQEYRRFSDKNLTGALISFQIQSPIRNCC